MLGALIGAGSSLLGGIFGRKSEKKAIRRQNEYNLPVNQRARWEAAGLNPAVFIAPGSDIQQATGGSNYMGQAIADAGAIMANEMATRTSERQEINALRKQNEELRKKTQKLTLRPATPGIYETLGGDTGAPQASSFGIQTEARRTADGNLIPLESPWSQRGRVDFPVTDYQGNRRYMARGAAERLDLKPNQMVIGEDIEAIVGESPFTETLNALNAPSALEAFGGSVSMPSGRQLVKNFFPGLDKALADNDSDDPRRWSRQKLREKYGAVPDGWDEIGGEYIPYFNSLRPGAKPAPRISIR